MPRTANVTPRTSLGTMMISIGPGRLGMGAPAHGAATQDSGYLRLTTTLTRCRACGLRTLDEPLEDEPLATQKRMFSPVDALQIALCRFGWHCAQAQRIPGRAHEVSGAWAKATSRLRRRVVQASLVPMDTSIAGAPTHAARVARASCRRTKSPTRAIVLKDRAKPVTS